MPRDEQIHCGCGGKLTRPLPRVCPHCGAEITGVKRRLWPQLYPWLLIGLMFSSLVGYLLWLMSG